MRKLFGVLVLGAIVSAGCNDMPTSSEPLASHPTSGPAFSMAGAIPGQYIVVLHDSVVDVPAVAHRLAAEHGATVHFTYTSALRGFAVANLPSQAAAALQHNPHVVYVEADEVITTTLRPS